MAAGDAATQDDPRGATELGSVSTEDLVAELAARGDVPRCPCGKWPTYLGAYDRDGMTWRCRGCLRAIGKCRCRRA